MESVLGGSYKAAFKLKSQIFNLFQAANVELIICVQPREGTRDPIIYIKRVQLWIEPQHWHTAGGPENVMVGLCSKLKCFATRREHCRSSSMSRIKAEIFFAAVNFPMEDKFVGARVMRNFEHSRDVEEVIAVCCIDYSVRPMMISSISIQSLELYVT